MTLFDLLEWLLRATLASTVAVVVVALCRKPVRRVFGPGVAYGLWALVPVSLIAVTLPLRGQSSPWVPAVPGVATDASRQVMQTLEVWRTSAADVATSPAWLSDMTLLGVLWGIGCVSALLLMTLQQRRFFRRLGPLVHRPDGMLQSQRRSEGLPAVFGVLHARIVVPADFEERFNAHERMLMQAHEHAHAAAGDLQANALAAALRCVFWFNPLLHWAAGRFRHDQEIACDARVLRLFPQSRRRYGEAMLKAHLAPGALPTACNWGLVHPFKERLLMLKYPAPGPLRWLTGVGLTTVLALGVGVAAWSAQPAAIRQVDAALAQNTASAPSVFPKVTLLLENTLPAEAARQVAEVSGVHVSGMDVLASADHVPLHLALHDVQADTVFQLIADHTDTNVTIGAEKVIFSER